MKIRVCQRCGGVFRLEACLQCGWAGKQVTDYDRLLAHERDDILDVFRLEGLRKRLIIEAAKAGLEGYAEAWYNHAWVGDQRIWAARDIVDQAISHAFKEVEAERAKVKPDHFRGYFNSKARKHFRELLSEQLDEQEKHATSPPSVED